MPVAIHFVAFVLAGPNESVSVNQRESLWIGQYFPVVYFRIMSRLVIRSVIYLRCFVAHSLVINCDSLSHLAVLSTAKRCPDPDLTFPLARRQGSQLAPSRQALLEFFLFHPRDYYKLSLCSSCSFNRCNLRHYCRNNLLISTNHRVCIQWILFKHSFHYNIRRCESNFLPKTLFRTQRYAPTIHRLPRHILSMKYYLNHRIININH